MVSSPDLSPQTVSVSGYFPKARTLKEAFFVQIRPSIWLAELDPAGEGGPTGGLSGRTGRTDGPRLPGQQLPPFPPGSSLAWAGSYMCVLPLAPRLCVWVHVYVCVGACVHTRETCRMSGWFLQGWDCMVH